MYIGLFYSLGKVPEHRASEVINIGFRLIKPISLSTRRIAFGTNF